MRPPLNAGENDSAVLVGSRGQIASMRPPLNAGENCRSQARRRSRRRSFNEAPAERGGKPAGASSPCPRAGGLQ